jgi:mRNA interferase YafQ
MPNRKIVISKSFEKAYAKFVTKKPQLKSAIDKTLINLELDSFSAILKTHKLSGKLLGIYDCRIIFSIENDKLSKQEHILLIDIGTHNEVY